MGKKVGIKVVQNTWFFEEIFFWKSKMRNNFGTEPLFLLVLWFHEFFLHFTLADGDMAKSFIMTNEDVLKKITNYMMHTNTKLQMAAVVCIYNLAFVEEPGAGERQARLKEVGVHKILGKLLTTPDPTLCEK